MMTPEQEYAEIRKTLKEQNESFYARLEAESKAFNERMEHLRTRHEALAESVELNQHQVEANTKAIEANIKAIDALRKEIAKINLDQITSFEWINKMQAKNQILAAEILEMVHELAAASKAHEFRLNQAKL